MLCANYIHILIKIMRWLLEIQRHDTATSEAKVQFLCMFGDPMCIAVWFGPRNRKRGGRRGQCYVIG